MEEPRPAAEEEPQPQEAHQADSSEASEAAEAPGESESTGPRPRMTVGLKLFVVTAAVLGGITYVYDVGYAPETSPTPEQQPSDDAGADPAANLEVVIGPDDDLQAAIDRAAEDIVLLVEPSARSQPIRLAHKMGIEVRGLEEDGRRCTIEVAEGPALEVLNSHRSTVEGFTLIVGGDSPAVVVDDGSEDVRLADLEVETGVAAGLSVKSVQHIEVEGLTIRTKENDGESMGARVVCQAVGTLRLSGLRIEGGSGGGLDCFEVDRTVIRDLWVQVSEGSGMRLDRCEDLRLESPARVASGRGRAAQLKGCRAVEIDGLQLIGGRPRTADDPGVETLYVERSHQVTMRECRLFGRTERSDREETEAFGGGPMVLFESRQLKLRQSVLEVPLQLQSRSQASLEGVTIRNCPDEAALSLDDASLQADDLTVDGCFIGIEAESALVALNRSVFTRLNQGLLVSGSSLDLDGCRFDEIQEDGLVVERPPSEGHVTLQRSHIARCGGDGLVLRQVGEALVRECRFEANEQSGMKLIRSRATVEGNLFVQNGADIALSARDAHSADWIRELRENNEAPDGKLDVRVD